MVIKLDEGTFSRVQELAAKAKKALVVDPPKPISFDGCFEQHWPVDEIARQNADFFDSLTHKGNVYAILTKKQDDDEWSPMYVGQRKSADLRKRMRQHLLTRDGSGSKLENVQGAVWNGYMIAVAFVLVCPEGLRHFVEETIIAEEKDKGGLPWNDDNPGG